MGLFKRRKGEEVADQAVELVEVDEQEEAAAAEAKALQEAEDLKEELQREEEARAEKRRAAEGPWDISEIDLADSDRLDLGSLHLPPRAGMEVRMEVEEATQRVVSATLGLGESTLQLQAFAAPRTSGIWQEIRDGIRETVLGQGGDVHDLTGPFGPELRASFARGGQEHTIRFVGVDGPRWFLRGVFNGPAALDETAAKELEEVFRDVVVNRGTEAMAPRDLLELSLPTIPDDAGDEHARSHNDLNPFERGPEITEVR